MSGWGLGWLARVSEVWVLEVQRVGAGQAGALHPQIDGHIVALSLVGQEQDGPGEQLTLFDEKGGFQEAAHLVPMSEGFSGRR